MFNTVEPTDPYGRIEKLHHTPKWYNKPLRLAGTSSTRRINELVDNITQLQEQVKKIGTSDLSDISNLSGLAESNVKALLCQQKTRIYKEQAIRIQGSLRRTPCHPFRNQPWKKKKMKELNTVLDLIEGTVFKSQCQIINTGEKLPEPEPAKKPDGVPATQIPITAIAGKPLPQALQQAFTQIAEPTKTPQSPQGPLSATATQDPSRSQQKEKNTEEARSAASPAAVSFSPAPEQNSAQPDAHSQPDPFKKADAATSLPGKKAGTRPLTDRLYKWIPRFLRSGKAGQSSKANRHPTVQPSPKKSQNARRAEWAWLGESKGL